ncbi:plastocyanin/azurin family copper-binding protein [Natrinema amylolyticum]|uniref:plastocyanin/azurin family copper-binding protein n=1 Tax=Natrinema amylolyticum TaxID=2878679 RepID=UPI001CF95DFF|nr:plastocyanin/azurin family copper-binding protein [Natrinema amylolyticum]
MTERTKHSSGNGGRSSAESNSDGDPLPDRTRSTDSGRTRRSLLSTTAMALAIGASGCLTNPWGPEPSDGDETTSGGDTDETDPPSNSSENATDDEETTDPEETEETETLPLEREPSQIVEVAPDGFQFDPESFEIEAGDTVHWIWMDSGHNLRVRSKPAGSDWEGTPGTASDTYDEGYEHGHTFDEPGEYQYFCAPHQTLGLEGTFTVR